MSNSYNGQQWNPSQINFSSLQLEQDFEFNGLSHDRQQQHTLQQSYPSGDSYSYPQQQLPSAQSQTQQSSSLHGAFALPPIQQQSHSRSSSFGTTQSSQNPAGGRFVHGAYGSQNNPVAGNNNTTLPYRPNQATFNFSNSMQGIEAGHGRANLTSSNYLTSSPAPRQQSFPQPSTSTQQQPQQSYYRVSSRDDQSNLPQAKRHHGQAFKDEQNDEIDEVAPTDQKDANKAKLSRACQRCKNLKVRCEAKTETEPCKRCFNGGHECIVPGRKIRRTPPKREHLLSQIQSQAKEIERLMRELEKVSVGSSKQSRSPGQTDNSSNASLHSPVLSPSSTSASYFSSDPTDDSGLPSSGNEETSNGSNPVVNKAVEDWIAKARESLHEFGAFIGIGGAAMPKSYLVDEDFEGNSSEEEEYVDVQDEFTEGEERYELAVEDPDGEDVTQNNDSSGGRLRHKGSDSSIGTVGTTSTTALRATRKNPSENSKPANLPVEASPFGLFGNLALKNPRSRAGSTERDDEDKGPGIANANFFKSTTAPHALGRRLESAQHQAPAILTRGIISPQEAEKLFKIYFDNMNLSLSILDPVLYTAQRTFYRSPFLFTVICAVASRFYSERSDLYAKCMHYAQLAAGTALIGGNKNVEMCFAYILLSLYPVPARKWEDQRSWLYLGLAIRTATDLNLHLPNTAKPLNENHAREMLNRTRVWMNCLNLDRSTGSQYGKPPIISAKDYIANHSEDWWKSSPYNMKNFDIHICAYNSELKVMAAFIAKIYSDPDHPTGLNKDVDFERIATETDDELQALRDKWFSVLSQTDMNDPQNRFRTGLLRLAYSYSRLIALSYGFQHAFGKNEGKDENPFLMRCLRAASDVVDAVVNDVCRPEQLHYFRHGPEAQSVFVTFASAFLVKLLQPRFASYLTPETRVEIRALVQKVIDLLGSPAVAIDERHGPKLYSRFLAKLLARPMARIDPLSPGSAANVALPTASQPPPARSNTYPSTKARRPKSASGSAQSFDAESAIFDTPQTVYNHPSPSTSNSLSPPATEAALSFDNFAPVGAIDPFAPETAVSSMTIDSIDGLNANMGNNMMTDFFQPPLPFDDSIVQSMQSLTDPSGWQDIPLPGFNWMAQFQENLGLDLNNPALAFDQNMEYMTGPANN